MNAVFALVRLEILRVLRNRRYIIFTLALPVGLYLMIGKQVNTTVDGVNFAAYYMLAMATYGAFSGALMGNSQRIAQERKDGWTRQLKLTSLPGWAYVGAKLAASFVTTGPAVVAVLLIGRFYGGVTMSAPWKWPAVAIALWLGSAIFASLAVAIGYRFAPDTVQPVTMLVYFPMLFLGGIFFAPTGALATVGRALPTWQIHQLGTDIISTGRISADSLAIILAWFAGFVLLATLAYQHDSRE